jgi:hypothetical protein
VDGARIGLGAGAAVTHVGLSFGGEWDCASMARDRLSPIASGMV